MLFSENVGLKGFKDRNGKVLSLSEAVKKITGRLFNYLLDIELFIVRIAGFIPIYTLRYLIYRAAGVKIGSGAHLHMGTQFFYPAGVSIGKGSIIGQNAFLDGRDKLIIGNNVDIASEVMIYNSEHDVHSPTFSATSAQVQIGDHVFIGPRAIILPGVTIKDGAVVGAGAVVTKDVGENEIVGGVPAKIIGDRRAGKLNYALGRARLFQ